MSAPGRRPSKAAAWVCLLLGPAAACHESPSQPSEDLLNRAAVIDALEYWSAAAGLRYELVAQNVEPRVLIRPGMDGLPPWGGGRAVIDGTNSADNRARSGLVVFEPRGGEYCRSSATPCRFLHRHEIGHALGFLGHSDSGLMGGGSDTLTDRERRVMIALYTLPHGAIVEADGRWSVPASGESGILSDVQAAQDIITWNMNAEAGSAYRQRGVITRWELPIRVYLAP